jgi:hypothetical protein
LKYEVKEYIGSHKKDTKRRKVYIFTVCFIISTAIWFMIKLSNVYDEEILFPVEYINIPENKVIVNNVDSFLVIHIKTTGFKLLEYKYLKNPGPLKIDLTRLYKRNSADNNDYFLLTSLMQYQIQQQVGTKNQLVSVKPDTLYFSFEKSFSKKVPVKLDLDLNFKKQFAVYDSITLTPDSIIVSGAYKLLKDIEYIETEKKSISNLSANTELILRLRNSYPKNLVSFNEKTVKIVVPVEKFTESVLELPVNLVNDNSNLSIKLFPDKVTVTYLVAMKDFKKINEDEFTAIADYTKRTNKTMKIFLLRYPPKVRITKIDPENIEYILIK